jgi:glycosyltransferase involved in cell wall biosynthesis
LPAIEAMACGAPVIAADAAALPETCAGAALLVPPSAVEWRDALEKIRHDAALRADLRRRGFERVRRLDPEASANALVECVRRYREDAR